ncbi:MAG: hypothetical protein AAFV25_17055 [Bacteroidota bacterium]
MILGGLFLLAACHKSRVQQTNVQAKVYKKIVLDSLVAHNLSEDATPLSSQEDEVYLWGTLVVEQAGALLPLPGYAHPLQTFRDDSRTAILSDTIPLPYAQKDSVLVIFSLLELDEAMLSQEKVDRLDSLLAQIRRGERVEKRQLDSLAGHDDFLGYRHWYWNPGHPVQSLQFRYRGLQLFDRYDYRLHCRLLE